MDDYDRIRDDRLDFPADPQSEPDLSGVKDTAMFACSVDESAGLSERRYGDAA